MNFRIFTFLLILSVVSAVVYCEESRHILGKRTSAPLGWSMGEEIIDFGQASVLFIINLQVGEEKENLLEDLLETVSQPNSPSYGKYIEHDELSALVGAPQESFDAVFEWLETAGLNLDTDIVLRTMDSIHVKVDVMLAKKLLHTSFARFQTVESIDSTGMRPRFASVVRQVGSFSIPSSLRSVISHIFGLSEFLPIKQLRSNYDDIVKSVRRAGIPLPKNQAQPSLLDGEKTLVTPSVLRNWYSIPDEQRANTVQSIYADFQWFNKEALSEFCEKFAQPNTNCGVQKQIGWDCFGSLVNGYCTALEGEADLDVQYISSMAPGATTWFWEVIDSLSDALTESLWILVWAQQVNAQTIPNLEAPLVHSISYGAPEIYQCFIASTSCNTLGYNSEQYVKAVDNEFRKMGIRGWTVTVSSGDDGAQGFAQNYPVEPKSDTVNQLIIENGKYRCMFPSGAEAFGCTSAVLRNPLQGNSTELGPSCLEAWTKYTKDINNILGQKGCSADIVNPMMQTMVDRSTNPPHFVSPSLTSNCTFVQYPKYESTLFKQCTISPYEYTPKNGEAFYADYPTSSPYVLSIGATQLYCDRSSPNAPCTSSTREIVASSQSGSLITSGGGFSVYHPRPSWQNNAASQYLSTASNLPPSSTFNRTNRLYPDIAQLGHSYAVYTAVNFGNGTTEILVEPVDGTSASSPFSAAEITLWNSALIKAGKDPLGYFNPMLYQIYDDHPEVFNDITEGDLACIRVTLGVCSQWTFRAQKGYDCASGLGSINFQKMLNVLLNN